LSNKFYQKLTPNESPSPVPDEMSSSAKKENQTPLDSQINEKEGTSAMPPAPLREIRHQRLHILSSIYEIDIFKSLHKVLSHINVLWELVLTGEPIVVLGNTPTECASMVQSIQSLISPLTFNSEVRPYFTIHDSEFKEFTQQAQGPPSIILGVTNPFFVKTLQHWPHILRLGKCKRSS
jgi:Stabilization of polarity axis